MLEKKTPKTLGPWFIVLIVAAFVAAGFVVTARKPRPTEVAKSAPPPVVTVGTAKAVMRRIPRTLVVTGSVTARDPLSIGAEASGLRIDTVDVEEGDAVKRGQVLATLDASVLTAQLAQMKARLAQSRASLIKAIQPNRPQDIMWLQGAHMQAHANAQQERANLLQAQASFDNADKNNRRYQTLLAQGFVTIKEAEDHQTDLDKARATLDAARERLRAAEFAVDQARQKLDLAHLGGRAEDIDMARASSREIEANIQQLEAQIAQTVIRAPDDGIVTQRDAHIGDIAAPNKVLFTMIRENRLELRAQIPEIELSRVRVGQRVRLRVAAREADAPVGSPSGVEMGSAVQGTIWLITPIVDAQTRLGIARIAIPPRAGLMPGMFVRAEIEGGQVSALCVPSRAVLGSGDDHYVFVLDGDRARRHGVKLGTRVADDVGLLNGVVEGDSVIVDGAGFLTDGDVVRVIDAAAALPRAWGAALNTILDPDAWLESWQRLLPPPSTGQARPALPQIERTSAARAGERAHVGVRTPTS